MTRFEDLPDELVVEIAQWLPLRSAEILAKVAPWVYSAISLVIDKKREEHLAFLARHMAGMINAGRGKITLPPIILLLSEFPKETKIFHEKSEVFVASEVGNPLLNRIRSFSFDEFIENPERCREYLRREIKRVNTHNPRGGCLKFQILPMTWAKESPNVDVRDVIQIFRILHCFCYSGDTTRFVQRGKIFRATYCKGALKCWYDKSPE